MKATGIVRRIDDLGRVVIPKEIRRTMRIREGAALEIFTDKEGEVIFKKYSPLGELSAYSAQYAEAISKVTGLTVAVCDRDTVVAAYGSGSKDVAERSISEQVSSMLESRKPFSVSESAGCPFLTANGSGRISYLSPIISEGDVIGGIMLLQNGESGARPDDADRKMINAGALFLSKQFEV